MASFQFGFAQHQSSGPFMFHSAGPPNVPGFGSIFLPPNAHSTKPILPSDISAGPNVSVTPLTRV